MNNLKIIDLNRNLIQEVKKLGFDAEWKDYFEDIQLNEVLITASNPMWTFGGGIDALFKQKYPELTAEKKETGGGMERIGNIVFAVSVNEDYKATKEIVTKAIQFALSTLEEGEVLRLHGIGCGIGGLSIKDFCDILVSLTTQV